MPGMQSQFFDMQCHFHINPFGMAKYPAFSYTHLLQALRVYSWMCYFCKLVAREPMAVAYHLITHSEVAMMYAM